MAKMNLSNITNGFSKVQETAAQTDNAAKEQLIFAQQIIPHPGNVYSINDDNDSIKTLANEIQLNGLINSVTVFKRNDGKYQIISGERRYRAMTEILKWTKIRCRVYDGISEDKAELMLHTANLDTREYTAAQKIIFYERCFELLNRMKASGEYNGSVQMGIAAKLQVTDRQVRKYKTIFENTSDEERTAIVNGDLTLTEAYNVARERKTGTSSGFEDSSKKKSIKYTLPDNVVTKYFKPEQKKQDIQKTIEEALAFYFANKGDENRN